MKTLYANLICAAGMQLLFAGVCNAQAPAMVLKAPTGSVTIDGQLQEWGDTLSYYNAETKIRYTISNDKDKLYLVVKVKDPIQESNILVGGLSFNVDTKGKKRTSFVTTFPSNGETPLPFVSMVGNEPLEQKALRAKYSKLKKIAISGYRDVNEDYITTSNTYGIQVAMDYDDKGYLVYEEAIPLELLHPGDLAKGEWSFNIKLNGLEKPARQVVTTTSEIVAVPSNGRGGGSPSGGRGGSGRRGGTGPDPSASSGGSITPTIDFWGRFSLAKTQ
ncbi:MAG: hypothetical protein ACXVAY_09480 [Mucilaginibacter sp.]